MKQDLKELGAILAGIGGGHEWQFSVESSPDVWRDPSGEFEPLSSIQLGHRIRIKPWTLPPPPEGREWHYGERFTASDLPEGYRPLLAGEIVVEGDEFDESTGWRQCAQTGFPLTAQHGAKRRTKRPLPEPKPDPLPLGPEDVPPGSLIRGAAETEGACWCLITSCSRTGVRIWRHSEESPHEITWETLKECGSQILRPGQDWQPCSKPAP